MKNFQVMIYTAVVFIVLGVYGYIASGSPTALIGPGIGILLIILSFPTKNNNAVATHIGVVLTALAMIAFFVVGFMRGNFLVVIMAVVALTAMMFYVTDFMRRKKEREGGSQS